MVMRVSKAQKDEVTKATVHLLDQVGQQVSKSLGMGIDAADEKLKKVIEAVKMDHQTVTLKIYRRDEKKNTFAFFMKLESLPPEQLLSVGIDVICQEQGGSGDYKVEIYTPAGTKMDTIGPFTVTGALRRDLPKMNEEEKLRSSPFSNLPTGQSSMNITTTGENSYAVKDLVSYMSNQSREQASQASQNTDRFMQMMAAQQTQSQNMLLALMTAMQPQRGVENDEVKLLKAQLEELKRQQLDEAHRREMAELRVMITQQKPNEPPAWVSLVPMAVEYIKSSKADQGSQLQMLTSLMGMMQNSSNQSQAVVMEAMKTAMSKPDETDKTRAMMDTMMTMAGNQVGLIGQVVQMGLLNQGGDSPVVEILKQAIGAATELGAAALSRGAPQDDGEEEPTRSKTPMPVIQAEPQVQQTAGLLPGHDEEDEEPEPGNGRDGEDRKGMVDLSQDPGLLKIINLIRGDGKVQEISARIWAHSKTGHPITTRWVNQNWTAEFTQDLLTQLMIPTERQQEVAQDLMKFLEHVKVGGNPNAWCADTGYIPVKPRRVVLSPAEAEIPTPQAPEIDERTIYVNGSSPTSGERTTSAPPSPAINDHDDEDEDDEDEDEDDDVETEDQPAENA